MNKIKCSFCEKLQDDPTVKKLVRSKKNPDVYICDGCLKIAKELAKKPVEASKG